MRLTLDMVRRAPQFTNPLLQREIDLRGQRISSLDEHTLVLLENQFDVVNLTSNALTSLEYFPVKSVATTSTAVSDKRMHRVATLIAHRNQLHKVSVHSCVLALPNLVHFLADQNNFRNVKDLCFLKLWKKLEILSLEGNPVWDHNAEQFGEEKLRAFLVFLCPRLKAINSMRVVQSDTALAAELKKEFKALVAQWEGSVGDVASADGKRIRKRGREGRLANNSDASGRGGAAATADAVAASNGGGLTTAANGATTTTAEASDALADSVDAGDDTLQARLDELEQRILSDDLTMEEMTALEQEITEITDEQARRQKRRR